MSVIKLPILFVGSLGETRLYSLFDSGANLSCINPDFLDQLEIPNNARRPFSRDLVVVEESYKQLLHGRAMAALERLAQGLPAQAAETILPVEPDTAAA